MVVSDIFDFITFFSSSVNVIDAEGGRQRTRHPFRMPLYYQRKRHSTKYKKWDISTANCLAMVSRMELNLDFGFNCLIFYLRWNFFMNWNTKNDHSFQQDFFSFFKWLDGNCCFCEWRKIIKNWTIWECRQFILL